MGEFGTHVGSAARGAKICRRARPRFGLVCAGSMVRVESPAFQTEGEGGEEE